MKIKTAKGKELETIDLKGKAYLTVQNRLVWLRDDKPDWSIETQKELITEAIAIFKATIRDESGKIISTAHGSETPKDFKDFIEKAETKSVGRALGYAGFGTQFMADELDEGVRIVDAPVNKHSYICEPCNTVMKYNKKSNMFYCPNKKLAGDEHQTIQGA